jgi:hypothetical protein
MVFTSSSTDPRECANTASIRRYDVSGVLLGQRTLKAGSSDTCFGDVFVDDMAAADGSLVLYGSPRAFPYLPEGTFLMRLDK